MKISSFAFSPSWCHALTLVFSQSQDRSRDRWVRSILIASERQLAIALLSSDQEIALIYTPEESPSNICNKNLKNSFKSTSKFIFIRLKLNKSCEMISPSSNSNFSYLCNKVCPNFNSQWIRARVIIIIIKSNNQQAPQVTNFRSTYTLSAGNTTRFSTSRTCR